MQELSKPESAIVKKLTNKEMLESDQFLSEIAKALPYGSPSSFQRAALTAIIRNPQLAIIKRQSSFRQCLYDLAQMGLYPDGRRAHLVPFGDQCQLIIDYKGIAELARRHGDVVSIHCDVVHEGEEYRCEYGTNGGLYHKPDPDKEINPVKCAYSYVKFSVKGRDGGEPILVEEYMQMSFAAIEKIRARSKTGNSGPWKTDWEEMAKKTVFRRHSKTLALSPETQRAVEYGEEEEFARFRNAVPAIIPKKGEFHDVEDDETQSVPDVPAEPEKQQKRQAPARSPRAAKVSDRPDAAPKEEQKPAVTETEEDFFQATRSDDIGADFAQQLDAMIKQSGIERAKYFEWLNFLGVRHARDEKLKVMAAVDLKPSDLEDCVENWGANLDHFKNWTAK